MKHTSKRLFTLVLALALALSLTACGGAAESADGSYDEDADSSAAPVWYTEVPAGTELYSSDTCSVVLTALESDDSGSTMTVSLTYSGEGALVVEFTAYDTAEYEDFTQGDADYVESRQYGRFTANAGEADKEITFTWDGAYEIFDVNVATTTEAVADDGDSSVVVTDEMESLYYDTLRVTAAE